MFNVFHLQKIEFSSNPDLGEDFVVDCSTNDLGSPINKVVAKKLSNKAFYSGHVYDSATMSLRAQLNSGVDLQRVVFGQVENDPTKLMNYALKFESSLQQRFEFFRSQSEGSSSDSSDEK